MFNEKKYLEDAKKYEGFYKVETRGYSITYATFYNPTTKEEFSQMVADFDDDRVADYNEYLYYLPIDEDVKVMWQHSKGKAFIGDNVKIIKGRKMLGEVKKIVKEFTYRPTGTNGYADVEYWVFEDGTKCIKYNCVYCEEI